MVRFVSDANRRSGSFGDVVDGRTKVVGSAVPSSGFDQKGVHSVGAMADQAAPRRRPRASLGHSSRYGHIWAGVAMSAAAVWVAIAVLRTPWAPMLELTVMLATFGGIFFVRSPVPAAEARREYGAGVAIVAGVVLVLVGMRQDLDAGLAVVAILAASCPSVIGRLG